MIRYGIFAKRVRDYGTTRASITTDDVSSMFDNAMRMIHEYDYLLIDYCDSKEGETVVLAAFEYGRPVKYEEGDEYAARGSMSDTD